MLESSSKRSEILNIIASKVNFRFRSFGRFSLGVSKA